MQDSYKPISRTTGLARRLLSVFVAAVLCVSLGIPSVAVTDAGFSLEASHAPAYADEGDGGGTDPEPAPEPAPEKTYVNVPYVMKMTISDAIAQLQAAGFIVNVLGDSTATSTVVTQDITGQAVAGSIITITGRETAVATPVLTSMSLGYVDPETSEYIQYPNASLGQVPMIKTKGGRIQMLATVFWSTGAGGYASDQGVSVGWSSSDTALATIDPTGMLTALKDGTVTITCTSQQYGEVLARIDVKIVGQDGAYVTEVVVTKEDGTPYRDERIMFEEALDGTQSAQAYATVYYSDGTEKHTWSGDAVDNLVWSTTDSEICHVNETTGRILPKDDGSVRVVATVTGGIDGSVSGYVYVMIDTGRYDAEYWPSDTLTIEVSYANDLENGIDTPWKTKTYDVGSFSSLGLTQSAYTVVTNNGHYATLCAEGVTLSTLLGDLGLVANEVSHFRLYANDGVGGAGGSQVSADYLFNRGSYFFPNMDIGLTNGAESAEPMIAIRDSWHVDSVEKDFSEMTEGRRFRLALGSSSVTDSAGSKTVKFINTIKIVMQGSAPVSADPGNENGTPTGGGVNKGTGSGSGTGTIGDGTGSDDGSSVTSGTDTTLGLSNQAESYEESAQSADAGASGGAGEGKRWQVFEMMSNAESDIDPIDYRNPLEPFLLPGILAVMVAGGTLSRTRLRREMAV